jgi:hypothetical protein
MENQKGMTGDFSKEAMGTSNAIRNFVEAKKGEENLVDKGKKKNILISALKKMRSGKK